MGTRGPKPVNLKLLSLWEFEFFKAFHLLKDGVPLPVKPLPPSGLSKADLRVFIDQLKRMSPEEYWFTSRHIAAASGERINLARPPHSVDRWWAEQEKETEIDSLKRLLNPRPLQEQLSRRKIWDDLIQADSFSGLKKVCGRWARLPDVLASGSTVF